MKYHHFFEVLCTIVIALLFVASLWQLATASWIPVKAFVAQQLLEYSWQQTINTQNYNPSSTISSVQPHKPWPWADTWPVARLTVPELDIDQIVLAGDNGSSLAFGPGYAFSSDKPNSNGLTVISGHRDTHFSFLQHLRTGQLIYIQTPGKTQAYKIDHFEIVDSRQYKINLNDNRYSLLLVSCYPFDEAAMGGTLRYLVFARASEILGKHAASVPE